MTVPLIMPTAVDVAGPLVYSAYDKWSTIALQAFGQAQTFVGDMGNYTLAPVTFDASFDPQMALPGFAPIAAPTVPATDLKYVAPPLPPDTPQLDLPLYSPTAPPQFDVAQPTYAPPATPLLATVDDPGTMPALAAVAIPDSPTYTLPDLPALSTIVVPAAPTLALPTFDAVLADFSAPIPNADFSFTPDTYVDSLLTDVKSTLTDMLAGDFVLPAPAATALRNRAYDSANREEARGIDQIYVEFAARGFEEPPGLLQQRTAFVREQAQLARMGTNRDVYVQDQQIALENLRVAVTGGIQLEGQLISLYTAQTQFKLQAAQFALNVALQIFQARVTQYNTQAYAFGVRAQVYRDQISAALAQAQIYATEVESARVQGELNMQKVQLYVAQFNAVRSMVDIYTAQVNAAEAVSRTNVATVEAFSAKVGAMKAQVDAQVAQWQGYRAQVDAQLGAAQFYSTSVNAYGQRVQAWATSERSNQSVVELRNAQAQMQLTAWESKLHLFDEQVKAELARVEAVQASFNAQVTLYKSQGEIAAVAGEYDNRRFQLNLAQEQAIVDTSLKRADANFEQMKFITTIMVEIKRAIATVEAQLAASAMNAVNIGGHVQSNTGVNVGWDTNVSFSGSVNDV